MKRIIRMTAVLTLLALLMTVFPVQALAEEEQPYPALITLCNDVGERSFRVYAKADEVYLDADTYKIMTGFSLEMQDGLIIFSRGCKTIRINPNNGNGDVFPHNKKIKIDVVENDGTVYFSASKLLPWMNVECEVNNGKLTILRDKNSIWDVVAHLSYDGDMFNFLQITKDSKAAIGGQIAVVTFDTALHCRYDQLIRVEGGSLYESRTYRDALIEISKPNELKADIAGEVADTFISYNKALGPADKIFGIDFIKFQANAETAMHQLDIDINLYRKIDLAMESWNAARIMMDSFDKINEYFDVFSCFKLLEIAAVGNTECIQYLRWIRDQGTKNVLFDKALNTVVTSTDNKMEVLYATLSDTISRMYIEVPVQLMDMMKTEIVNPSVKHLSSVFHTKFFKSIDQYLAFADIFYNTVFPISQGFESAAQIGPYSKIQDYFWQDATEGYKRNYTQENLKRVRQGYIMALRASKAMYQGYQQIVDAKLFGKIQIGGLDGSMDGKIRDLDTKILQFMALDSAYNDSSEGKEEFASKLQQMFSQIEIFRITEGPIDQVFLATVLGAVDVVDFNAGNGLSDFEAAWSVSRMPDSGYMGIGLADYVPYIESGSDYLVTFADFQEALKVIFGKTLSVDRIAEECDHYAGFDVDRDNGYFVIGSYNGRGLRYEVKIREITEKDGILYVAYDIECNSGRGADGELRIDRIFVQNATFIPTGHPRYPYRILSNQLIEKKTYE